MSRRNLKNYILAGILILLVVFSDSVLPVLANNDVYNKTYNIHAAIAYADEYTDKEGDYNSIYGFYGKNGDCTNFVSQCISVAGGLPQEGRFVPNDIKKNEDNPWTVPQNLYDYLTGTKGYDAGSFSRGYSVDPEDGSVSVWKSGETNISVGDIVFFDEGCKGEINHAALVVGLDESGTPCYAAHSVNRWMEPLWTPVIDRGWPANYSCTYYIVHMTDTAGLTDVTSQYIDKNNKKIIAIKSVEVDQYISCNTDQNVDNVDVVANSSDAGPWEYFEVIANEYGEVGFRACGNGNFLSARVDLDAAAAPIRAAYGQNYSAPEEWESFRIFEKDGIQYIRSQANGKWVQVSADKELHTVKACGQAASTWERFVIEIVDPLSMNDGIPAVDGAVTEISDTYVSGESSASVVNQAFGSGYNEGLYTGEWSNGMPNGWGRLDYIDYNGDGKFYKFFYDDKVYNALYYEGNFSDGARWGNGTVVYEDGWKEEGTFYGAWEAGKKVFEGKVWHKDGSYYLEGCLTATSNTEAEWTWDTDSWQLAE